MAMTIQEMQSMLNDRQADNRRLLEDWIRQGKTDVSPTEAAPILGVKHPYALNLGAKEHPQPGMYWRGCRLRISVKYLLNFMEARYEQHV